MRWFGAALLVALVAALLVVTGAVLIVHVAPYGGWD